MSIPASPSRTLQRVFAGGTRWVLLAMLLALHFSLVSAPGSDFQRIWLLVHFGLFLLWQPFFDRELKLGVLAAVLLVIITGAILYFVAGWMIVMWLSVLLGILGGKVFTVRAAQRGRLFFLAAFTYLLAILLIWAVPALVLTEQAIPPAVALLARSFLPFLLAALLVLPLGTEDTPSQVFDFIYAVVVFQLVVVLVLGSLALMRFTHNEYYTAVALTMVGFGVALFVLAVLWSPRGGSAGLGTYFSRYLLSLGMPFEDWMRRVAEFSEGESDPERFLSGALQQVLSFPWVRGGRWSAGEISGAFGVPEGFPTRFTVHGLELTFHTSVDLSPALFLHLRLVAQVVGEFHEGKRREGVLRRNAYLQAVHETGAQLTHDIKNILQALYALTSMKATGPPDEAQGLLHRQLPHLARRLHTTLEKLRAPEIVAVDLGVDARRWWSDFTGRYAGPGIAFQGEPQEGVMVPAALFDTVAENFLDNALAKRSREPGVAITISFEADAGRVELRSCDDGSAVPEPVARRLFREPVEHEADAGLGIGLYQAARQARQAGYTIELSDNRKGAVCFRLRRDATRAAAVASG